MNNLNFIVGNFNTDSKKVPTIPSDICLTFVKIKELIKSRLEELIKSRLKDLPLETKELIKSLLEDLPLEITNPMYLQTKQICDLFLAGQLKYLNEEYESSMNEAPQKKVRFVIPEKDIDFDRPETLLKLFP